MTITNAFITYQALGYGPRRLVPIVPPDAEISESSSLHKRVGTPQDGRGKTPGVRNRAGLWHSFDWVPYEADEEDLTRWHAMGAGVGVKTGDGLVAIDADTTDAGNAHIIRDIVEEHLGRLPIRVGRYPKALYLCRTTEPYRYTRVDFGARRDNGLFEERVEILSDGRQFVAHGIHPGTRQPYHWPRDIIPFDDLPAFTPGQLDAMMSALRQALPQAAERVVKEGGTAEVNQKALTGKLEHVRKAVEATPNTSATFATRESYRDFGYAIKAALPDDEPAAKSLFLDWCARWQEGENDPGTAEADWSRMKPPFRRGAGWLYELAERVNPNGFSAAETWFDPIPEDDSPFAQADLNASKDGEGDVAVAIHATPYGFPDIGDIKPREWLYGTHYIRAFVSATVAPSGVGKSSLEIVEALAMASGKPLLGIQPKGAFRVWLWNGEDPLNELNRRVAAAMQHYGLTREDIGDRLFIDSGRTMEIVLAQETREGVKINAPVETAIMRTIGLNALDVLQIDPFVSSHRVSENDNGAIDLVSKRWARIADAGRVSIELVHHVRKLNGSEITVEDSRGAVALIATSRSARAIARMTKGEAARLGLEAAQRRLFRFADGKNNLALPADSGAEWLELCSVALGNGPGEGLERLMGGDSVGVVRRFEGAVMAPADVDERGAALELLRSGSWRRDVRAGDAWAGCAIAQAMRLDVADENDRGRVKAILTGWIKDGTLVEVTKLDAKRMQKSFVEVAERDTLSEKPVADIFE